MRVPSISLFFFAFFLILICYPSFAKPLDHANLSTKWTIAKSDPNSINFQDGSMVIPILLVNSVGPPEFSCGFICYGTCMSYHFGIFIVETSGNVPPQVVWLANRDHPVGLGASLNLTPAGDLVLQDFDGSPVWATDTAEKSVAVMNLTDTGNLVLFDDYGSVVWQSFDYPTDCLLPGQKLVQGKKLIASVSSTNWTTRQSLYSWAVTGDSLYAYFDLNTPPYTYYKASKYSMNLENNKQTTTVTFVNGILSLFFTGEPSKSYMKLTSDGHLKVFEWQEGWTEVADLLANWLGKCDYPMACGRNAICSNNQQCRCLVEDYFRAVNDGEPYLGCYETNPLTCNAKHDQHFVPFDNLKQFTFTANLEAVDVDTCKEACLNNCTCKAALFKYDSGSSGGNCYLPSELFTLTKSSGSDSYSAFIKVQGARPSPLPASPSAPSPTSKSAPSPTSQSSAPTPKRKNKFVKLLSLTIGSFIAMLVVVIGFLMLKIRKRKLNVEKEEDYLDQVPGMPTRFSYEKLQTATEDFSKKLGEGGYGSVFEGILEDGSKIAVKRLDGLDQVKKSFLAEVESIGSIHHVNLVRLRGFCACKSKWLLVYEFMSNGSLDKWIYYGDRQKVLEWACRKKIILDIAKGLAYLHEDCRQKIIHLDIKPQNILLDDDFNAKISDFGLSKLIDRNQTQVMTNHVKGTLGYIAPESRSSVITVKMDVYSFGIVLLEILCGRKILDTSLLEENWNLLGIFQKSWEQGTLSKMVDSCSDDMQANDSEVMEMMKLASWCLQYDPTRRPPMSSVVKVLEGGMNVESNLDYNFTGPRMQKKAVEHEIEFSQVPPSVMHV